MGRKDKQRDNQDIISAQGAKDNDHHQATRQQDPPNPSKKIVDVAKKPEFTYDINLQEPHGKQSSDYGADSFSDFPSPSALLLNAQNDQIQTQSKREKADTAKDLFDMDDDWLSTDDPWNGFESSFTELTGLGTYETPKIERTKTNTQCQTSKHDPESHHGQTDTQRVEGETDQLSLAATGEKRKLSTVSGNADIKNGEGKRRKNGREDHRGSEFAEPNCNIYDKPLHEPSMVPISTEWEDIDPDLLNEFKDIVNFF